MRGTEAGPAGDRKSPMWDVGPCAPRPTAMGRRARGAQAALKYHFWRDMQHGDSPEKIEDFWEFLPTNRGVREFGPALIWLPSARLL